jgi:phage shock protein C
MEKRLYRSQTNRVVLGICGGLGEYFGIDPVIMRVIAVVIIIVTSIIPGLIAYFVLGLVIPLKGSPTTNPRENLKENLEDMRVSANKLGEDIRSTFSKPSQPASGSTPPPANQSPAAQASPSAPSTSHHSGLFIFGILFIVIGVAFLIWNALDWFWFFRYLWPAALIVAGFLVVLVALNRKSG